MDEITRNRINQGTDAENTARDEESRVFAVNARDCNVLLAAAAGSGKTTTLVERIVTRLLYDTPAPDIDAFLIVTFTNAAAAELRQRIESRLSEAFQRALAEGNREVAERAYKQRLLLPKAAIGTIDAFCLDVVKKNFMSAGIDPVFRIDDKETDMILSEVADRVLETYYAAKESADYSVLRELVDVFCTIHGDDLLKENLLIPVFRYAVNFPNPREWLALMEKNYEIKDEASVRESVWYQALLREMRTVCEDITAHISQTEARVRNGTGGYGALLSPEKYLDVIGKDKAFFTEVLSRLNTEEDVLFEDIFLYGDKPAFCRKPTGKAASYEAVTAHGAVKAERSKWIQYYDDCCYRVFGKEKEKPAPQELRRRFLHGIASIGRYVRLLHAIVGDIIDGVYAEMQRRRVYSFSRIAHLALEILCEGEPSNGGAAALVPSPAARMYGALLKELYIDEYQDTSLLQECILYLVSGLPRGEQNMFMVGDVKQSIYGFRQAKPRFFTEKYRLYKENPDAGRVRVLSRNFRSRKQILDAVNTVFAPVMTESVCGISYAGDEMLCYGAHAQYDGHPLTDAQNGRAELCLCVKNTGKDAETDPLTEKFGAETLLVIDRILRLFEERFCVYEKNTGMRPIRFSDIAVLTRNNQEAAFLSSAMEEFGLPAETLSPALFFERAEVLTVLDFLRVIDNPYQDIPVAAVLRSAYYHFSDNELALIRAAGKSEKSRDGFYETVCRLAEDTALPADGEGAVISGIRERLRAFCEDVRFFRGIARAENVSQLLWVVVNHRGFYEKNSETGKGNLRLLLEKAYPFDSGERAGLFGFLSYMDSLSALEGDSEPAFCEPGTARERIQVMTIHKSKGLEFPVLFLYGAAESIAGKAGSVYLHEKFGLGFKFLYGNGASGLRRVGESAAYRALSCAAAQERLGEEQRLLYVAMTRAREKLFVTASVTAGKRYDEIFSFGREGLAPETGNCAVRAAETYLDMIFLSVFAPEAKDVWEVQRVENISERFLNGEAKRRIDAVTAPGNAAPKAASARTEKKERTEKNGPDREAEEPVSAERLLALFDDGSIPAKLTVSAVKKLVSDAEQDTLRIEERMPQLRALQTPETAAVPAAPEKLSPSEFGTLMHRCIQFLLKERASWPEIPEETEAYASHFLHMLHERGILSSAEFSAADVSMLSRFLLSPRARQIKQAESMRSEVPFTFLTDVKKYFEKSPFGKIYANNGENEKTSIALQGVIDLYYTVAHGIVLVDFKTDRVSPENEEDLLNRYSIQLACYVDALEKVTGFHVAEAVLYFLRTNKEYIFDRNIGG